MGHRTQAAGRAATKRRAEIRLVIGAVVTVLGVAFGAAMLVAAEVLEAQEPGDYGWSALSWLGIFGGLVIVGTGLTVFLRAGYLWITGKEPPLEDESW